MKWIFMKCNTGDIKLTATLSWFQM